MGKILLGAATIIQADRSAMQRVKASVQGLSKRDRAHPKAAMRWKKRFTPLELSFPLDSWTMRIRQETFLPMLPAEKYPDIGGAHLEGWRGRLRRPATTSSLDSI